MLCWYVSSITHLGKSFYHEWMLNFIKCFFCIYLDNHVIFVFSLLMWDICNFFPCDVFFWLVYNDILLMSQFFILKRIAPKRWQRFGKHPIKDTFWVLRQSYLLACELDIISPMFCSWIQNADGSHAGCSDNWLL